MLNKPTVNIVGTPDLPRAVRAIFGDKLLPAHEQIRVDKLLPGGKVVPGGALVGYRVSFMDEGKPMLSNVLVGDDGITFYEDDVQEATKVPDDFVPCRRDYFVCPDCLREISAHAYNIEGLGDEDRPHPSIEDAWDEVEGCDGFCGGDRCENPPQRVYWTKVDGTVQAQDFPSTKQASLVIAGIVQWHPALVEEVYLHDDHDSLIEAYEALPAHQMGEFLRLDRDDHTGEPMLPGEDHLFTYGKMVVDHLHHKEVLFHGVTFVIGWDSDTKHRKEPGWVIYPKAPLPEPTPTWG